MNEKTRRLFTFTIPALTAAALIVAAVWGRSQRARAERFERLADEYASNYVAACTRCGRELAGSVSQMESSLMKLRVTASAANRVLALEDIVRESGEAAGLLSRIPQSQAAHIELAGFLTRAGDFARTLSKKLLADGRLDETDVEQLEAVLSAASRLAQELDEKIANGEMPVGTEDFDYYDISDDDEPEPEYPALAYDGAYSAAASVAQPLGVSGEEKSPEEALREAERILGEKLGYAGRTDGAIPCYDFASEDGEISASVTVRSARLLSFMRAPSGDGGGLPDGAERERLTECALAFLESAGYPDMAPLFASYEGGTALISFAAKHGEVFVLGDLVKVWIDRGACAPVGLDAREYLMRHHEREWEEPSVTEERAREAVSELLDVTDARLVLAPLTPLTETLCWEFRGSCMGGEYLVWVNAATGREERIARIISDETGERVG
ncbi:MAG: germination protein YpeB [Clostridia bacterium]|nr:germination protein YpeB [Clostridia bacterium]